ncbi:relaxase/mobilization nuclease domain-containing protein [Oceanicaulis sp. UBA2681]|uniref:relaxase/mobilization nuclease domain-containing protein n=1 Tax=Oceanicaulis sp. UBA2681 TaxID=1947007 RepID=UPI00257B3420|nr:relaxase/mobilization nuclease domain-containing protein [Oceanicaulis sp. UBA2681]|tara:strand:+ start:3013 stop:4275 length:1263 start_codon:yes stop_codon:yes gene_type:complete
MILNGNQRGGAKDLAVHLMKEENDHIELYELRGFVADDLMGAFGEAQAISKGTRCKQFLFSLSLNPPEKELVAVSEFEAAIDKVEKKLGLEGQPRAIVFHEKNGRRHAHAVWSRIDTINMKAIQLSHSHRKLRDVSREIYREHGWVLPSGLIDRDARDPKNFSLAEWQQARRVGKDPRAIKSALQDAWAISDSKSALMQALEERGFTLAKGDRRGFVVLDRDCEIYSLPKWLGIKTKVVREKVGPSATLISVEAAKAEIALAMTPAMQRLEAERRAKARLEREALNKQRKELVRVQRAERRALQERHRKRRTAEAQRRQDRYLSGIAGVWDMLRGEKRRIKKQNELEAWQCVMRDRSERDALIFEHLEQRRELNREQKQQHRRQADLKLSLTSEQRRYEQMHSNLLKMRRDRTLRERERG